MGFRRVYSAIALDVGPASVAMCQLARRRAGPGLYRWGVMEDPLRARPEKAETETLSVERTARLVEQTRFHGHAAALALKPPDVTFLTAMVPDELREASPAQRQTMLRFEAGRHMQADPESLEVDYWPLPPGNRSGANVMIVAAQRETLDRWLRFFDSVGLQLSRIDVLPCAVLRSAWRAGLPGGDASRANGERLWGVLDIGFYNSVLVIALGGHCVYVRTLPAGGDAVTTAVVQALQVDYHTAETLKRRYGSSGQARDGAARTAPPAEASAPVASAELGELDTLLHSVVRSRLWALASDVERAFAYAMESYPEATPVGLYVCGGGARLERLPAGLQELLGVEVTGLNPCPQVASPLGMPVQAAQVPNLAACVGLALGDME